MKDENTVYESTKVQSDASNNDATQYHNSEENKNEEVNNQDEATPEVNDNKSKMNWKVVSMGGAAGVMLGAAAAFLATNNASAGEENPVESEPDHHPITDGEVQIATSVNEEMSFSDAFAAARAEFGPGGAFEWHGNVYSTYTAEEWNSMSPEDKAEYGSHFNWSSGANGSAAASHASHSNTVEDTAAAPAHESEPTSPAGEEASNNTGGSEETVEAQAVDNSLAGGQDPIIESDPEQAPSNPQATIDDVAVAGTVTGNPEEEIAENTTAAGGEQDPNNEGNPEQTPSDPQVDVDEVAVAGTVTGNPEAEVTVTEPDVEILGVANNGEDGTTVGGIVDNGEDVVMIDVEPEPGVDNPGTESGMIDIYDSQVAAGGIDTVSPIDDSLLASNDDASDYINDANVYDI